MAFTIKELASLSGIKAHTIRIWEQRYGFLKPSRTLTNIRKYSNEELKTLLTVALLNRYGFKISHIDGMLPEQRVQATIRLQHADARTGHLVNQMIGFMIDLDSISFEHLLNRVIGEAGIETAITQIIFAFMEKVGILWQTDRVLPAQEHIVSNIIRQKIVSAIEELPFPSREDPLFLLFLPEDEHHEIGLLFVYYLLRKSGLPVIYLGANVPLHDLNYIFQVRSPKFLYLHLTAFPRQHNFQKFLNGLGALQARVLISGSPAQLYKKPMPDNITVLQNFQGTQHVYFGSGLTLLYFFVEVNDIIVSTILFNLVVSIIKQDEYAGI
jgi:DNA-binding transcriptional MerR regulator